MYLNTQMMGMQYMGLKIEHFKRTCEANAAGENNSFIFTVCVKSVPLYHFNPISTGGGACFHRQPSYWLKTPKQSKPLP